MSKTLPKNLSERWERVCVTTDGSVKTFVYRDRHEDSRGFWRGFFGWGKPPSPFRNERERKGIKPAS